MHQTLVAMVDFLLFLLLFVCLFFVLSDEILPEIDEKVLWNHETLPITEQTLLLT